MSPRGLNGVVVIVVVVVVCLSPVLGNLISAIFVLSAALIAITLPKITTVFSIIGTNFGNNKAE